MALDSLLAGTKDIVPPCDHYFFERFHNSVRKVGFFIVDSATRLSVIVHKGPGSVRLLSFFF